MPITTVLFITADILLLFIGISLKPDKIKNSQNNQNRFLAKTFKILKSMQIIGIEMSIIDIVFYATLNISSSLHYPNLDLEHVLSMILSVYILSRIMFIYLNISKKSGFICEIEAATGSQKTKLALKNELKFMNIEKEILIDGLNTGTSAQNIQKITKVNLFFRV